MPDKTIRYRAATRYSYALALRELARHARDSQDDFEVYPDTLDALEHTGLAVTGDDLAGVRAVLAGVEGLEPE